MAKKKKITRKELFNKPDEFITVTSRLLENSQKLFMLISVIIQVSLTELLPYMIKRFMT
jgi:hypothetical protein